MAKENLKKSVNFVEAIAVVIGMIIGSGIFLKPGAVFGNAGSPLLGLLAWLAGGIITLASALTIAEIGAAIPKTGGLYIYLEELYGPVWGYLLGWVQSVIVYPAAMAAQGIAFATFASFFINMGNTQLKICAIIITTFIVIMNILSTRYGGMIQTISTVAKLIPIFGIIIFGFIRGEVGNISMMAKTMTAGAGFGAAMLSTLWAYDGWINVTNIAGELKNPEKDLPKAIIFGVSAVVAVYVVFNYILLNVLGLDSMITSTQAAADAGVILFGNIGGAFIVAGMMISVLGALNGNVMTGARVPFAMANRDQLPFSHKLKHPHKKFGTPSKAILFQFLLALLYILSGSFNSLTDLIVFVLWIFFTMGVVSIFILRKRYPEEKRPYKTPLYPIVPIIGIVGGLYILVSTLISNPINSLTGIGITLLGLPIYFIMKKKEAGKTE